MKPKLRCRIDDLSKLAVRYNDPIEDTELDGLRKEILKRGYMTKDELRVDARWKATRSAGRMERNTED